MPDAVARPEPAYTRIGRDGSRVAATRPVAAETPVQIRYGDVPFAVMMATPADLDDFALGFSLTEGVIGAAAELRSVSVSEAPDGLVLDVAIAPERLHATLARRRTLSGRTGCGVCGIDDLRAVERAGPRRAAPTLRVESEAVHRALAALPERQSLGRATGATHAAAWADADGTLRLVREDVGRHNALDKLVGAGLRAGVDPAKGFVVVTSRCSFEMVEKTALFGARMLVAISGPTSLAISRAVALDVTLAAFSRDDGLSLYHAPDRIV